MSYRLEFDKDNKVLCTAFEGQLSFADFLPSEVETRRYIQEKTPVAGIWDYSEVTSFDVSPIEVRQMAKMPPIYPPGVPRFAIAPSDYVYRMFRMFQILGEENRPDLQVVRTRKEAYKILGFQGMNFERI